MKDRGGGKAQGAEVTISCIRKSKRTFMPTGNMRLLEHFANLTLLFYNLKENVKQGGCAFLLAEI